jgi:NAD(P)H-dependent flavin oxidoreductase YrpB (nitropropane dioxygenase family)
MPGAHDAAAFDIIALTPWAGGQPAIAAGAANGGGIGVLDLELATGSGAPELARRHVNWIVDHVAADAALGLRLHPADLAHFADALTALGARPTVVIFTRVPSADQLRAVAAPGRRCLVEVRSSLEIAAVGALGVGCDGLVACGNECGGPVGDDTTYVLVQRLLAVNLAPVYARGGIGLATATGCRVAGARGVVLDDQLLLMPESPLSAASRHQLQGLTGQETVVLGSGPNAVRVFDRPVFTALAGLKRHAQVMESGDASAADTWPALVEAALAWHEPATSVWPAGQGIALAERYQQRFGNTRTLVAHFAAETARRVALAQSTDVLAPGAALAASHGTTYPIVQGPMTRVSDVPAFAAAVADAGALPLIALAVLTGPQARPVLEATRDALGTQPWGVGVLGFVPAELKQAQLDEVRRVRPPFALVAGGRPDDAARLEADGIATYLHVPVASCSSGFSDKVRGDSCSKAANAAGTWGRSAAFPCGKAWSMRCSTPIRRISRACTCCSPVAFTTRVLRRS